MPYYLHPVEVKGDAIELAEHARLAVFAKQDALTLRAKGETIAFIPNRQEMDTWRDREYRRLHGDANRQKEYQPLPFATPWEHYAHRAKGDPEKIAYTPDHTYGHEDRRLVTTPGRYLEKYADLLNYSRDQFQELCAKMRSINMPLAIATSADDIARVYTSRGGPTSCMDREHDFDMHTCPARAYAGGDLAVAYLGTLGTSWEQDRILARAVIWPERKTFVRAYGDVDAMIDVLKREGYRQVSSWDGARLRAIEHDSDHWVVPYIDGGIQRLAYDGGDYLVISRSGQVSGTSQDGYVPKVTARCRQCGDRISDPDEYDGLCSSCFDDRYICASCSEEDFGSGYPVSEETYCGACYRAQRHTCEHCGSRFSRDEAEDESGTYCDSCYPEITTCEHCDTEGHADDLALAEHGDRGESWCLVCRQVASRKRTRRPAMILSHLGGNLGDSLGTVSLGVLQSWIGRGR